MEQKPSIGRVVHYVLTAEDCLKIQRRRTTGASIAQRLSVGQWPEGAQAHIGNVPDEGEHCAMTIVRVWPTSVNGQVLLDGNDCLWVTSVHEGIGPGTWHWPERV